MIVRCLPTICRVACIGGALLSCNTMLLSAAHAQQPPLASPSATAGVPQQFTRNTTGSVVNLLSILLNQAGASYIIGPGVTGDISVHFSDLSLDTALDRIAQSFSPPLVVSHLQDGTYIIRAGEKGPRALSLSTPPTTVTVRQEQPQTSTIPPVSVSVVGGDPVAVALELQIISLRVEREAGAATQFGPGNFQLKKLDVQIATLEKQLALHKATATKAQTVKTAQVAQQTK